MNNIISPVTGSNNTTLTDIFFAADIIKLYKSQLDFDVTEYFSGADSFFLYQCNDTGYRFYHPYNLKGDEEFYDNLSQSLGDSHYPDWKFEYQLAYDVLKPGDKVLDIGCARGNFLNRAKNKAKEVTGLELNKKTAAICHQNKLTVFNESISEHAKHKPEYYDVVCLFQVLEHIYDVRTFLEDTLKVLRPGGQLVIGVPNNEPYFLGYDKYCTLNLPPHHMGLWNKDVFEKMALLFNLKIRKVIYDLKGSIRTEAYLRSKYIAHIKSPGGQHSTVEKIKMIALGIITVPRAIIKKITKGINGSHMAAVFVKM